MRVATWPGLRGAVAEDGSRAASDRIDNILAQVPAVGVDALQLTGDGSFPDLVSRTCEGVGGRGCKRGGGGARFGEVKQNDVAAANAGKSLRPWPSGDVGSEIVVSCGLADDSHAGRIKEAGQLDCGRAFGEWTIPHQPEGHRVEGGRRRRTDVSPGGRVRGLRDEDLRSGKTYQKTGRGRRGPCAGGLRQRGTW